MNKLAIVGAALLATTAMPVSAATITLAGSTATATLLYPDSATAYAGPATATVGAGVEFPFGTFNPAFGSFDIGANTISFFSNQMGNYGTAAFNGYRLDFGRRRITSLSIDPSSTFSPQSTSFSGSSVFFNVSGQDPQAGNTVFNVGVGAVPEPAAWGLMILGFGVVGATMRRRSTVRTTARYA